MSSSHSHSHSHTHQSNSDSPSDSHSITPQNDNSRTETHSAHHQLSNDPLRLHHSRAMGVAHPTDLNANSSPTVNLTDSERKATLKRICSHCSHYVTMDHTPLPQCSRCHITPYCGSSCQRAAWKVHKKYCVNEQDIKNSNKSPSHQRFHDVRQLPTLADIANVFGSSYGLRKLQYCPPGFSLVTVDREEYESRVKQATKDVLGYFHMQGKGKKEKACAVAVRQIAPNVMESSEYREARTIALLADPAPLDSFNWTRYEMLTDEFVTHLANYLRKRLLEIQAATDLEANKPLVDASSSKSSVTGHVPSSSAIVELGASDGLLSFHLNAKLKSFEQHANASTNSSSTLITNQSPPIRALATDSNSWQVGGEMYTYGSNAPSAGSVMQLDVHSALKKLLPKIVIVAWMPMYHDWTAAIRACSSVQEYILIGPAFTGQIGHLWDTWGIQIESSNHNATAANRVPPFERDGFSRHHLHELSKYQVCQADKPTEMFSSATVAFRRRATEEG